MQRTKVTIKDIALKTGLSVSAVSFALSGKGRINAKTREFVIQEAEKLGYKPNVFASTLPMKNKIRIGVICPENDIYFRTVLQGIKAYYSEISHYKVELLCKLLLHSCGAIRPIINDLIEIGIDNIAQVKDTLGNFNGKGDYVFAQVHNIMPGVPLDHIIAVYET